MQRFSIHFIILWLFFAGSLFSAVSIPKENSNASWYQFLNKISGKPYLEQLGALEKYMACYPESEMVFHKILNTYLSTKDLQGAEQFFLKAAMKPECRFYSQWMLANLYFKQKRYNEAFAAFHIALECKAPPVRLCNDYWKFLYYSPIQPTAKDTLFVAEYEKNTRDVFYIYRDFWQSNYAETVNKILHIEKKVIEKEPLLYTLGYSLIKLKKYDQADSIIQVGLEYAQNDQNCVYKIKFLFLWGFLYYNKSDYNKAIKFFHSAFDLGNAINVPEYLTFVYEYLGALYFYKQEFIPSQDFYQRARDAYILYQDFDNSDFCNYRIAWLKFKRGLYSQALNDLEQLELNVIKNDNKNLLANIIHLKIFIYDSLYQNEMAERECQKLLALTAKGNFLDEYMTTQLSGIHANIFYKRGEYKKGRTVLWHLINQLAQKNEYACRAWCMALIGYSYNKQQEFEKAEYYFRQANMLSAKTNEKYQTNYYLLSVIENSGLCGKYFSALSTADTVIQAGLDLDNPFLLQNAYWRKGQIYEKISNYNKAIKNYQKAIYYTETSRDGITVDELRIGYFLANYKIYRGLTRCFYNRYLETANPADLDSLFYYEEMQRGRSFKDKILEPKNSQISENDNTVYQEACRYLQGKQRDLRRQAGTPYSNEQWDLLMSELEAAKYQVIAQKMSSPDSLHTMHLRPSFSVFSLNMLQRNLDKNDCGLIMYHIDEQCSFALVATKDTVGVIALAVHPDSLREIVDALVVPMQEVNDLTISEIPFRAGLAYRLCSLLYQPVAERFVLPERLLIIPEGALSCLPFEILLQQKPDKSIYTPTDAPVYAQNFLQQKHAFFYSPTSAVFRGKKLSFPGRKSMLILANPQNPANELTDNVRALRTRTGWSFAPLPFADHEGRSIKKIVRNAQLIKHEQADEQAFLKRAWQYNIVHFATHAFVDTSFDAFSGLILSTGNDSTDDGILMGYEIKSIKLDCDLVTLSACETGRGKNVVAEGVLGLPRLFLSAGACAALVSHWKVDDRFTSLLMPEFYRYYLQKKMTRADALACARRNLLATADNANGLYYQHPFFWAAFTLYGDPGPATTNPMSVAVLAGGVLLLVIVAGGYRYNKKRQSGNS
ncbi:MAG TPA: CHAT domain-containing protein [bacterium]|nr:CHAT domain-containing protein [bacterium]HPN45491.1 CHAT domain-containing protein [bacterium]